MYIKLIENTKKEMIKLKNKLLKNTLIIISTGFIVKIIGMLGKIITTRVLGLDGMSKYALSFPTLLLFVNIAGFSMNNTMSKLVSEAIATKQYSPKILLKKGIKTTLFVSSICIIIYLLSLKTITNIFLKDQELSIPLLFGTFLIPLVGISDALRGYFNGLKEVKTASISLFLEQLFRTTFSLIGIIIGIKYSIIFATATLYLALSIGELSSIIYCLIKLGSKKPIHYTNTVGEQKIITKTSSYLTLSKIIGSISYFLEPIIYTNILLYLNYETNFIHNSYTTIDVYTIPLLTIISFIPFSLSTAIIPHISESFVNNEKNKLIFYLKKAFFSTLFPAMIFLLIIYFYSNELMNLLFKTTKGANLAKNASIFFIFYYLNIISSSILQALGRVKFILFNSILNNILRLLLILVLPFFPIINVNSIFYSIIICIIISAIINLSLVIKTTQFKIPLKNLFKYLVIFILSFLSLTLFFHFNINYLLSITIIIILNLFLFILILRKKL